ncbi:MAG: DUF6194 family protein [Chloroflexota bacterium]
MTTEDAPDAATVTAYILGAFDDVDVVTSGGGTFFSCNAETHWPNFATLVTTDEFDEASDLSREGTFRLNMGVRPATFKSLVGEDRERDFTAFDRILPHPVYAQQRWICIVNPSAATFETVVKPLLAEAHEIVSTREARKRDAQRRSQATA